MSFPEAISLGFDLRTSLVPEAFSDWTLERRAEYLWQPDVNYPLSVDSSVWHYADPTSAQFRVEHYPLGLSRRVRELGEGTPSWQAGGLAIGTVIQVKVILGRRDVEWDHLLAWWKPDAEAWGFSSEALGFDVADRFLISGLFNCQLTTPERDQCRARWADAVNGFGLFVEYSSATEYASTCDQLIKEHAPFFVYQILRINEQQSRRR